MTLVLQGTTLGPIISRLSVVEDEIDEVTPETVLARKEAATAALDAITAELSNSEHPELADKLVDEFKERLEHAEFRSTNTEAANAQMSEELEVRLSAIKAARNKIGERRDELDGETFATLVQELDLEEEQIRVALSGPSEVV